MTCSPATMLVYGGPNFFSPRDSPDAPIIPAGTPTLEAALCGRTDGAGSRAARSEAGCRGPMPENRRVRNFRGRERGHTRVPAHKPGGAREITLPIAALGGAVSGVNWMPRASSPSTMPMVSTSFGLGEAGKADRR
jgi:hypothetical protein